MEWELLHRNRPDGLCLLCHHSQCLHLVAQSQRHQLHQSKRKPGEFQENHEASMLKALSWWNLTNQWIRCRRKEPWCQCKDKWWERPWTPPPVVWEASQLHNLKWLCVRAVMISTHCKLDLLLWMVVTIVKLSQLCKICRSRNLPLLNQTSVKSWRESSQTVLWQLKCRDTSTRQIIQV